MANPAQPPPPSVADEFVRNACLNYSNDHASRHQQARELLGQAPTLPQDNLVVALTTGHLPLVSAWVSAHPEAIDAPLGPCDWAPLLYACYSRVPGEADGDSLLAVAQLLLDRGADANAGFLWEGHYPPFTALTGAFGKGESGPRNQPPHPQALALAEALLAHGADPNDSQALYNCHFTPQDDHLALLLAHGLGQPSHGPWYTDEPHASFATPPAALLQQQLAWAAVRNFPARVRLLARHGVEVDTPDGQGRTPWQNAVLNGNEEIGDYLLRHGARRLVLDPIDTLVAAAMAAEHTSVQALLATRPDLLDHAVARYPDLLHRAIAGDHLEALHLLLHLGLDVNASPSPHATPLHQAAWVGNVDAVQLLLEHGADASIHDDAHHATPLDWARYNQQTEVAELLAQQPG